MTTVWLPNPPSVEPDAQPWVERAVCKGAPTKVFFPEGCGNTGAARMICKTCPVTRECLDYAIESDSNWGIYAGLSGSERARLRAAGYEPGMNPDDFEFRRDVLVSSTKFTPEDVAQIKRRLLNGEKQQDIADSYNVRKQAISKIATGASWSWVEPA